VKINRPIGERVLTFLDNARSAPAAFKRSARLIASFVHRQAWTANRRKELPSAASRGNGFLQAGAVVHPATRQVFIVELRDNVVAVTSAVSLTAFDLLFD